jgi:hypothetical protein
LSSSILIDDKNGFVSLKDITIEDPTLYQIVKDIESEQREGFIKTALVIGAIGLRNMVIAENVDFVEKEFEQIRHELELQRERMETKIKEVFNINDSSSPLGSLVKILSQYFDADTGTVADLLDPDNSNSPLHRLRSDLEAKMDEVNTSLKVRSEVDKVVLTTPLKGGEFEELVESQLIQITNHYGDNVKYVGDNRGRRGKKGDFVIYIGGDETRTIVIECKDSSDYTHRKVTEEIEAAMENRGAKFGIFLFNLERQIPRQMRPVRIANDAIITSFEGAGLYYAYRVARLVLESANIEKDEAIAVDTIQEQLIQIQEKCSVVKMMQAKVTTIENAALFLRENLRKLEEGIESCLLKIQDCLAS